MPILARAGAAAAKGFGMLGKIAAAVDEYFEYVTLLLHGNGTNGAQNNTFLDSSTNNFTITRNGNTTQGTFTPYGSNWSNYFDGSGDYLDAGSNAALAPGSGVFTWECWLFPNSFTQDGSGGTTLWISNTTNGLQIGRQSTGAGSGWGIAASGTAWRLTSTTLPTNGQWNHIAISRDGSNNTAIFLNGTRIASGSVTDTFATASTYVGGGPGAGQYSVNGYLSNVRFVKGTAVYDPTQTTLTVPTSPLTAITNTSLLTCQSNRFIDNSSNNFTITRNGDVSIQRFSPFAPTTPYAAGTIGGSGYFDGTGDYLVISSGNVAQFGTGDFTMEAWVYLLSHDGDESALMTGGINFSTYTQPNVNIATDGTVNLNGTQSTSNTVPLNTWTHIAVSRNSGTSRIFINGVQGSSASNTSNYNGVGAMIGLRSNGSSDFGSIHAYISNVRYVNGTGLYTSAFTPNTAPLSAVSGTSLLLNFTNGGIIDNAMMNDLETVGNAQISTSVSKFGGGSIYLDGTGDWLAGPPTPQTDLGSGDFTIEAWLYRTASGAASDSGIVSRGAPSTLNGFVFGYTSGNVLVFNFNYSGSIVTGTTAISANTWTHVAVSRNGNTFRLFVNGVVDATATSTNSQTTNAGDIFYVGRSGYDSGRIVTGYLDDVRITKGYARYTANFSVPTAPFPDQ